MDLRHIALTPPGDLQVVLTVSALMTAGSGSRMVLKSSDLDISQSRASVVSSLSLSKWLVKSYVDHKTDKVTLFMDPDIALYVDELVEKDGNLDCRNLVPVDTCIPQNRPSSRLDGRNNRSTFLEDIDVPQYWTTFSNMEGREERYILSELPIVSVR